MADRVEDGEPAAREGSAPKKRRLIRAIPTSFLLTLLGIGLTAWLLPALTRQRDDRQKAHQLAAQINDEMASATAAALYGGRTVYQAGANGTVLASPAQVGVVPPGTAQHWELASFAIDAKLRADYPTTRLPARWQAYSDGVREFFLALAATAPKRSAALTAALRQLGATSRQIARTSAEATVIQKMEKLETDTAKISGHGSRPVDPQLALFWGHVYASVQQRLLANEQSLSAAVLAAHPVGYSTTFEDFLRDLVP